MFIRIIYITTLLISGLAFELLADPPDKSSTFGLEAVTHDIPIDNTIAVCTSVNRLTSVQSGETLSSQMGNFFSTLLDTGSFPARWQCGNWSQFHGWFYIISDLMTWASYFAIPGILLFFIYKRRQSVSYHKIYGPKAPQAMRLHFILH